MFRDFIARLGSDCFDRYPEEIERQNRDTIGKLIIVVVFVALLNLLADLAVGQLSIAYQPLALICAFALFDLFYHFKLRDSKVSPRLTLYVMCSIPLLAGIAIGTFLVSTKGVFTFAVLLPVASIFVLDRPRNVVIWIASTCLLFGICAYVFKPWDVFMADLSHLFIYGPLATGAALFVLEVRIANVEQAMELKSKSDHDALTGVYNRGGGDERIERLVDVGTRGLLVFIDVDDFKDVNDTYGHAGGDAVLQALSRAIAKSFRSSDIVMRAGGDEFVVFAPGLVEEDNVLASIRHLRERVSDLVFVDKPSLSVTISLGCIVNDGSYPDFATLRARADDLLYEVKQGGKDGYRIDAAPYRAA